ncbi:MAG: hypothetical protein ACHREM_21465, partial [Polyangiales bacterium]
IHPSRDFERRDVVLEHDHKIVATCSRLCTVTVPRGDYVVHEIDGRRDEQQPLTIDHAIDVDVIEAERWRKSLGLPTAVVGSAVLGLGFAELLSPTGVEHAGRDWAAIAGGGVVAIFGFWLTTTVAAATHLDVRQASAAMAIAPSPSGASLVVVGAF